MGSSPPSSSRFPRWRRGSRRADWPQAQVARCRRSRRGCSCAPGPLPALRHHPETLAAVVDTFAELRALTAAELAALAAGSRRSAEVVDLFRAYRRVVGVRTDDHDALVAAAAAVRDDDHLRAE